MFESRYQVAQFVLGIAFVFAVLGILTLMFGSILVGVVCLVLEHAAAAVGCAIYANAKGYSPLIGIPFGVGLGVMGGVVLVVLPDEAPDDDIDRQHRMASEAYRNARKRDPGYEVLDDDD